MATPPDPTGPPGQDLPPPPPHKGKKGAPVFDPGPLFEQVNSVSARLRMNEERYNELRKKVLLVEQNMLQGQKKAISEIKGLHKEILDLKRQMAQIQDRIITVIKEIQLGAKKEDLDVMKKYIEYWKPLKFITMAQAEKIVEEKLAEYIKQQSSDEKI